MYSVKCFSVLHIFLAICYRMGVTFHESVRFNDDDDYQDPVTWNDFIRQLKQQRLKGQIPVVTQRYAISVTVFFALLFLGISQLLAAANQQVILIRFQYDNITSGYIDINITKFIPAPVYFYYELRNTFQMHRSLNQAYCKRQLVFGDSTGCDSFKNSKYACENPSPSSTFLAGFSTFCANGQKFYAPVGGISSIMFNDYFKLTLNNTEISWTEEGVIVDKRRETFFQPEDSENLCDAKEFRNTVKPIGWNQHICEMGGYRNISFIKWLEPSTNKNFKKLYRILNSSKHDGLRRGVYRLYIDNVYNPGEFKSKEFKLEKYFWILHPSWFGTEQKFLEIMYLIVGAGLLAFSCFLVGFQIFLMDRRRTYDEDDD
ncbi:unnamed protein product [Caenorhabditis brenneri]